MENALRFCTFLKGSKLQAFELYDEALTIEGDSPVEVCMRFYYVSFSRVGLFVNTA